MPPSPSYILHAFAMVCLFSAISFRSFTISLWISSSSFLAFKAFLLSSSCAWSLASDRTNFFRDFSCLWSSNAFWRLIRFSFTWEGGISKNQSRCQRLKNLRFIVHWQGESQSTLHMKQVALSVAGTDCTHSALRPAKKLHSREWDDTWWEQTQTWLPWWLFLSVFGKGGKTWTDVVKVDCASYCEWLMCMQQRSNVSDKLWKSILGYLPASQRLLQVVREYWGSITEHSL